MIRRCSLVLCGLLLLSARFSAGQDANYASPTQVFWDPEAGAFAVRCVGQQSWAIVALDGQISQRHQTWRGQLASAEIFAASTDGKQNFGFNPWLTSIAVTNRDAPRHLEFPQAAALTNDGTRYLAFDAPGRPGRDLLVTKNGDDSLWTIPDASSLRGLALDPLGRWLLAVHLLPKSHLPSTQIEQGWVFTNALTLIRLADPAALVTFPLDSRLHGHANPEGIAVTPDGALALVACTGDDTVLAVDLDVITRLAEGRWKPLAENHPPAALDVTNFRRYVRRIIPVESAPRGLAVAPDGKTLAVTNRLSDSVSLVDLQTLAVRHTVRLSDRPVDRIREGERLFFSGKLSLQGQFSCASCHPDGHTDGLNWDLPADGFNNFQNTKSLFDLQGTAPYGWLGTSDTLSGRFSGTLRHLFGHEPTVDESAALQAYLQQLAAPWKTGESESPAALRGRDVFTQSGCAECHAGTKFTDFRSHAVLEDAAILYDTPSLLGVGKSAPYLHDGRAASLEEIFSKHNPRGVHGRAEGLTAEEWSDLVDYLKSL